MFGHDDQNNQNQYDDTNTPVVTPNDGFSAAAPQDNAGSAPTFDTSSISLPGSVPPVTPEPTVTHDEPQHDDTPATTPDDHLLTPTSSHDDLLSIKQTALQQLSPLVGHLEQTPEEKFRTTMMMIQASDDQSLIQTAYEAAQAITDEKVKAQALLDVINEINYFTQQHQE